MITDLKLDIKSYENEIQKAKFIFEYDDVQNLSVTPDVAV